MTQSDPDRRTPSHATADVPDQRGILAALLVVFFGIAIGGPALQRAVARKRRLEARVGARIREARFRVREADRAMRRRLGSGRR